MGLDIFEHWGRGAGTFLTQMDWMQALAALLVVIVVRAALGKGLELVGHRMARVAQRSSNRYDDLIADHALGHPPRHADAVRAAGRPEHARLRWARSPARSSASG